MAGISDAAGPEWAYLAQLTRGNGTPTELDTLFLNIIIQKKNEQPETKVVSLQTLNAKPGLRYGPHDVLRFSFARLRQLTGIADLDLIFYRGSGPGVAIPDEPSFQRLLLAVRHLGLPAPGSPTARIYEPPVLRFLARPKPEINIVTVLTVIILILLAIIATLLLVQYFGQGAWGIVIFFLLIIGSSDKTWR